MRRVVFHGKSSHARRCGLPLRQGAIQSRRSWSALVGKVVITFQNGRRRSLRRPQRRVAVADLTVDNIARPKRASIMLSQCARLAVIQLWRGVSRTRRGPVRQNLLPAPRRHRRLDRQSVSMTTITIWLMCLADDPNQISDTADSACDRLLGSNVDYSSSHLTL